MPSITTDTLQFMTHLLALPLGPTTPHGPPEGHPHPLQVGQRTRHHLNICTAIDLATNSALSVMPILTSAKLQEYFAAPAGNLKLKMEIPFIITRETLYWISGNCPKPGLVAQKLRGHDNHCSVGFHLDDYRTFYADDEGGEDIDELRVNKYHLPAKGVRPKVTDTFGCGINFGSRGVFFTYNGR